MKPRRIVSRLEPWPDCPVHVGRSVGSPALVAEVLAQYAGEPVEYVLSVALDVRHRIVGVAVVSQGTATESLVHPREVFGPALRVGAVAVIVAHCHPSGDPSPSPQDFEVTRRLIEAGRILGIPLLDHVVLGAGGEWRSIRAEAPALAWNAKG